MKGGEVALWSAGGLAQDGAAVFGAGAWNGKSTGGRGFIRQGEAQPRPGRQDQVENLSKLVHKFKQ